MYPIGYVTVKVRKPILAAPPEPLGHLVIGGSSPLPWRGAGRLADATVLAIAGWGTSARIVTGGVDAQPSVGQTVGISIPHPRQAGGRVDLAACYEIRCHVTSTVASAVSRAAANVAWRGLRMAP